MTETPAKRNALKKPFELSARVRSFRYAIRGITRLIQSQHNAWVHAGATAAVLVCGFFFHVSAGDWCWISLAIALVWITEALNTAIEFLADAACPDFHPLVRDAKDVAAGAVLLAAITSAVTGSLVFWPHIVKLLRASTV